MFSMVIGVIGVQEYQKKCFFILSSEFFTTFSLWFLHQNTLPVFLTFIYSF